MIPARRLYRGLALAALLLAAPAGARSQQNEWTITGFPITFSTAGLADFTLGHKDHITPISFVVNARSGNPNTERVANVSIRCGAPCTSQTKAVGDLQWRRGDQGTWNALTTTDATIEQRSMFRSALNDPWGNDVYWRIILNYGTDLQGTSVTYSLIMTLTMSAP